MRYMYRPGVIVALCLAIAQLACSTAAERTESNLRGDSNGKYLTLPSGTTMVVALDERLGTATHRTGDAFTAHTTQDVVVNGMVVVPKNSAVLGRLAHVEEPHRTAGKAEMTLSFERVRMADGEIHPISTGLIVLEGKGDAISDEEKVAGGAVIGGIIGALTSKQKTKGAATGAIAGAAAGGAIALATKGQQLELPAGQRFALELTRPVNVEIARLD